MFQCASFAFLPEVVGESRLEAANGRLFGTQTLARELIGRAAGGALFVAGRVVPLLVDALSFLVSAALLVGTRGRPAKVVPRSPGGAGILAGVGEGVRVLFADRALAVITLIVTLINLVWAGQTAIVVVLARHDLRLSDVGFGLLLASGALGGMVGGALVERIGRLAGRRVLLAGCVVVLGLSSLGIVVLRGLAVPSSARSCWSSSRSRSNSFSVTSPHLNSFFSRSMAASTWATASGACRRG